MLFLMFKLGIIRIGVQTGERSNFPGVRTETKINVCMQAGKLNFPASAYNTYFGHIICTLNFVRKKG